MPRSILYYRSQLHWLGGMGIIVRAVALLPMLGVGGMQLFKAETPGPMKDNKLTPRIMHSARALWVIYVILTAACAVTFYLLGMTPRSEEHTSELQSLMRISYAAFCLQKKITTQPQTQQQQLSKDQTRNRDSMSETN